MPAIELPTLILRAVVATAESSRVVLVNRNPGPEENCVPVDSTVSLEIVDLGPSGLSLAGTFILVNGALAFNSTLTPPFAPAFGGPLSSVTQTADTLRLVIHPVVPFASLARVILTVASRTNDGVAFDASYSFTIEDRTAPRVVAAQATAQKAVRVAFDEPIALPPESTFTLTPIGAPAVPLLVVSSLVKESTVELTLDVEMTPDVEYEVTAQGVTDLFGNAVMSPYDRARFVGYRPARPPSRRFDLWEMLPKHSRRDDLTGDLRRFIACLQEVMDLLLADIDRFPEIFDYERAPETFLDCILLDLGNPFFFDLELLARRKLAALLVEMYSQKGTAKGIRNAVRFFLGIEITAISPLNAATLVLGESELGVDWTLGPSDRFARYAFNVEVDRVLRERERAQLRTIVNYLRPAHTHFVELVVPSGQPISDSWDLGVSELGRSTALN